MYQIRIAPVVCLSSLILLTVKIAFVFDNLKVLPFLIRLIVKQKKNEQKKTNISTADSLSFNHKFTIIFRYDKCKYAFNLWLFPFLSICLSVVVCLIWHSTILFILFFLVTISKTFGLRFREFHFHSLTETDCGKRRIILYITHIVCWFGFHLFCFVHVTIAKKPHNTWMHNGPSNQKPTNNNRQ